MTTDPLDALLRDALPGAGGDARLRADLLAHAAKHDGARDLLARLLARVAGSPGGEGKPQQPKAPAPALADEPPVFALAGVAFTLPRRRLALELGGDALRLRRAPGAAPDVAAPYAAFARILALPTPARAAATTTFVLISRGQDTTSPTTKPTAADHIVFALPTAAADCDITSTGQGITPRAGESSAQLLKRAFAALAPGLAWVSPNESTSNTTASAKNGPKFRAAASGRNNSSTSAYVDAHYKAKDGFLFFLPDAIFYGFRKPLFYFPLAQVSAIQVLSVTHRTFNLEITVAGAAKYEFAMIAAAEYDGIMEYIAAAKSSWRACAVTGAIKEQEQQETAKAGEEPGDGEQEEESSEDEDYVASDDGSVTEDYESDLSSADGDNSQAETSQGEDASIDLEESGIDEDDDDEEGVEEEKEDDGDEDVEVDGEGDELEEDEDELM